MAAYDPLAQIAGIFFISNNFSNVFTFRCPHFGEYNMETLVVHYPINNSLYSTNSAATYQYCCVCHKTFCQNLFVFVLHFIKKNFDISSIIKDNNNFGGAGMTKRHSSKEEQQNYTKLDNDYVRNTDKAINRKAQSRKRKLRRIVFFCDCASRHYCFSLKYTFESIRDVRGKREEKGRSRTAFNRIKRRTRDIKS